MPYQTNADLPESVKRHLPDHAQDIYRAAFNHAYADHAGELQGEERAHRMGGREAILCESRQQLDRQVQGGRVGVEHHSQRNASIGLNC